jgi:hypothetical protein
LGICRLRDTGDGPAIDLASVTPEEMARMEKEWGNKSESEISADAKRGTDNVSGGCSYWGFTIYY